MTGISADFVLWK